MINRFLIIFLFLIISLSCFSQDIGKKKFNLKWLKSDITVRKSGPYIGLQRGVYLIPEFGGEMQWKKVKLINPITNAVHVGFTYNFLRNVLGYDMGYWFKTGRLNLTYGANLIYRTDFTHDKIGFAPVLGFKFTQLHLQTGYHFMAPFSPEIKTNTFFVSLRFVLVNNRSIDFDKP
jgi:hypothetical protein